MPIFIRPEVEDQTEEKNVQLNLLTDEQQHILITEWLKQELQESQPNLKLIGKYLDWMYEQINFRLQTTSSADDQLKILLDQNLLLIIISILRRTDLNFDATTTLLTLYAIDSNPSNLKFFQKIMENLVRIDTALIEKNYQTIVECAVQNNILFILQLNKNEFLSHIKDKAIKIQLLVLALKLGLHLFLNVYMTA